jgi:hypothetical protein
MTRPKILRGDERLEPTHRYGAVKWFCPIHGADQVVWILAFGERYRACKWCLWDSGDVNLCEAKEAECP